MMNITKLVVGQKVWMISSEGGHYWNDGIVVEVTPSSVVVQLARESSGFPMLLQPGGIGYSYDQCRVGDPDLNDTVLVRFDANGKTCDSSDIYKGDWIRCDPGIPCTEEGPWELVEEDVAVKVRAMWESAHKAFAERRLKHPGN